MLDIREKATALLRRFYGYDSFRPLQFEIISAAVYKRQPFVTAIRKHKGIRERLGSGFSPRETLLLLQSGYDIPAIAETKGIKTQTVYNHIAQLIDKDMLTEFSSVITREQYVRVMQVAKEHPEQLYEMLAGEMPVGLPKVALAISNFLLRQKEKK